MEKGTGVVREYVPHALDYDYERVCGAALVTFPEEYEIPREHTGTLKDQGTVGACVAEVIAQLAEAYWNEELEVQEEHSEGHFYGAGRGDNSNWTGMVVSSAMNMWRSIGTLPKKHFDVLVEMPEMQQIVKKYPELYDIAKRYHLSAYVAINPGDRTRKDSQIKDALTKYNRGLVAVSHEGFRGGSHCIMLTGWNDRTGKYKYKNSWGEDFGDKGYAEIDKTEINDVYLPIFEGVQMPFKDVPEDAWYYNDIKNMYFAGFATGTSEDTFEPNRAPTRAEMFAVCRRILKEIDKRFDTFNKLMDEKFGDR